MAWIGARQMISIVAVVGLVLLNAAIFLVLTHNNSLDGKEKLTAALSDLFRLWSPNKSCSGDKSSDPAWKTVKATDFTAQQVIDYFYWTNRSSCRLAHDVGGVMVSNPSGLDGQKAVCLDPEVAPNPDSCLVYSFGINNEWSFDDAMEKYGCEVHAFDPSLGKGDYKRSERIHFYNLGIGGRDYTNENDWKINSLTTIYRKLGHEGRVIDYLKIDVEGAEWMALPEIISSGMLKKVRQLAVEIHWNVWADLTYFRDEYVTKIKSIEDAGMVRFDSKLNPWSNGFVAALNNYTGATCFELAWYQIDPNPT